MHVPDDLPLDQPFRAQPGLIVERRSLFEAVAAACVVAGVPGARRSWRHRQGPEAWTVEQFVREVAPVCRELVKDRSGRGQDRYLQTLAAHAVCLGEVPVPETREVGPGHRIGSNHGPDPFVMLHWQLEAGAKIEPHAHTYGNVVTLGLTGTAWVHNYEVVGERDYDSDEPFEVVRVQEQLLRRGDVNLVSLERHYVHGFVAGPDGASGLDITTRVAAKRATPVLELGRAVEAERGTFAASWRRGG